MKKVKLKLFFTWVLQVILGLEFILAGQAKFSRADVWTRMFEGWGYPPQFSYVIGGLEVALAIALFFPKYASKGAVALGVIMLGAVVTHIIHGEFPGAITTSILAALLALLFFARKTTK